MEDTDRHVELVKRLSQTRRRKRGPGSVASILYGDKLLICVEGDLPMPKYFGPNETREARFLMEISGHDPDRIIGTKRRVREANLSSMLATFYATADDSYVAVGARLEEFAMTRVGLTD